MARLQITLTMLTYPQPVQAFALIHFHVSKARETKSMAAARASSIRSRLLPPRRAPIAHRRMLHHRRLQPLPTSGSSSNQRRGRAMARCSIAESGLLRLLIMVSDARPSLTSKSFSSIVCIFLAAEFFCVVIILGFRLFKLN